MECGVCQNTIMLSIRNIYGESPKGIDLYKCGSCGTRFEVAIIDGKKKIIKKLNEKEN